MNVIEIFGKFIFDRSELDKGLDEIDQKTNGAMSGLSSGLANVAKVTGAAIAATATGVGVLANQATSAYGEFQQLSGGIETMFGTISGSVAAIGQEALSALSDDAWSSMGEQLFSGVSENAKAALGDVGSSMDLIGDALSYGIGTANEDVEGFTSYMVERLGWSADQAQEIYASMSTVIQNNVDQLGDYQSSVNELQDASAMMMENANKAFATAGLSANQYMEIAIQSSAAMINALGGDTVKAAELTDMSITDMADNVNKMGTTMEAVQNAYRGFSRGNFTMLDNLALGFSGTKDGMQELLDKAKEFSGIDYDIESYADIVQAIHVVQENMGITGTTAAEAAGTITGSAASMKAAWQNLVAGLADPNADLGLLIDNMVQTATTSFGNFIPTFANALQGIGDLVNNIEPIITEQLPVLAETLLPPMLLAATNLIMGLISALPGLLQVLLEQLPPILGDLFDTLSGILPQLLDLTISVISQLTQSVLQALPGIIQKIGRGLSSAIRVLMPVITSLIVTIVKALTDPSTITSIVNAGIDIALALVQGITEALPVIISALPEIIQNIITALTQALPVLIDGMVSIVNMVMENAPTILSALTDALPQIIEMIVDAIITLLPLIIEGNIRIMMAIAEHLPEIIKALIDALPIVIDSILQGLSRLGGALITWLSGVFGELGAAITNWWSGKKEEIKTGWDQFIAEAKQWFEQLPYNIGVALANALLKVLDFADNLFNWVTIDLPNIIDNFIYWFKGLPGAIFKHLLEIVDKITNWAEEMKLKIEAEVPLIISNIEDFFKDLISDAWDWGWDMIDQFFEGLKKGWNAGKDFITEVAQGFKDQWGHSHPKTGPMADDYTWMPDMMDLFIQGIRDNTGRLQDQIEDTFNIRDQISDINAGSIEVSGSGMQRIGTGAADMGANQPVTVVLELDKVKLAETVFTLNKDETQRMGVQLAYV